MNTLSTPPVGLSLMCFIILASMILQVNNTAWAQVNEQHSSAVAPTNQSGTQGEPQQALLESSRIRGLWVWRREHVVDPAKRAAMLEFCTAHRFNLLMVQARMEKDSVPTVMADQDAWRALLAEASARSILVEALEGDRAMALTENWPTTLARLDAILAFNRTQPVGQRLAGIHYDIEPYLLPQWKTDQRPAVMEQYLQFLLAANTRLRLDGAGLTLAVDIPFWLDHKTEPGDSCILAFLGQTKNFHQHIQDLTDYIGIMSYRQRGLGPNSITAHCAAELDYARQIGRGVCAGAEVGAVKETPTISFSSLPPATFWREMHLVQEHLAADPAFRGLLIHSYDHLPRYLAGEGAEH